MNHSESSFAILDLLARLDPARRDLQQELDRENQGQQSDVRRAYVKLLRLLAELGFTVSPD